MRLEGAGFGPWIRSKRMRWLLMVSAPVAVYNGDATALKSHGRLTPVHAFSLVCVCPPHKIGQLIFSP